MVPEILGRLGGDVCEQLHLDPPSRYRPDSDVEEDDRVLRVRRPQVPIHRPCGGGTDAVHSGHEQEPAVGEEEEGRLSEGHRRPPQLASWRGLTRSCSSSAHTQ